MQELYRASEIFPTVIIWYVIRKRVFFGYTQVFIIGEEAAKYIMGDIIRLFDRTSDIRTTGYIAVTPGKAEDIVSTYDPDVNEPTGRNIYDLIKVSGNSGSSYGIQIYDFTRLLALGGIEPVAPRIIAMPASKEDKEKSGEKDSGDMQTVKFDEPKEGHHKVEGFAAFDGENLAGWLDGTESRGWAWITGKSIRIFKSTKMVTAADTKNTFAFQILKSNSKIKVRMDSGKPVIYVDVNVEASLRKGAAGSGLLTQDEVNKIEKELSESIRLDIDAALKKGQEELKSDIFGFGFALYRKYPRLWHSQYEKNWAQLFPDIPVNVDVKAKVVNTGTNVKRLIFK